MATKILVVEHQSNAPIGQIGVTLRKIGATLTIVGPEAAQDIPETIEGYDGLIVLGGMPGPYDDDAAPWLPAAKRLLAQALQFRTPILGVCLGSQLLTVVAGGRVTPADQPEIGVVDIHLAPEAAKDPLLKDFDRSKPLRALEWHYLETSALPEGSSSLAWSELGKNQVFRVGPNAWGVQFHMEADAGTPVRWSVDDAAGAANGHYDPREVISAVREEEADLLTTWAKLTERWHAIVLQSKSSEAKLYMQETISVDAQLLQ